MYSEQEIRAAIRRARGLVQMEHMREEFGPDDGARRQAMLEIWRRVDHVLSLAEEPTVRDQRNAAIREELDR